MSDNMNVSFTNYTQFGIHNTGVRYTWVVYAIFIILSSLIGDFVILVASIKYNAFRLHKAIVAIMQHLAVCDIITSLNLTQFLISLIAEKSILGTSMCYARSYIIPFSFPASFYLTAAMTTTKALMLKFPLQARLWTKMKAHLVCGGIWLFSLSTPLLMFIIDKDDLRFDYRQYACHYSASSDPAWEFWLPIMGFFTSMLPITIVITTTTWLIIKAKKVAKRGRSSLRWQGLSTVILTAVVYCLSVLPIAMYYIVGDLVKDPKLNAYFYRSATSIACLSVISNFYIYSLTVNSFRELLVSWVTLLKKAVCGGELARESEKAASTTRGRSSDTPV